MNIKNVLSGGAHWQVNKHLSRIFGDLRAAVLLSDFIDSYLFFEEKGQLYERDGLLWFFETSEKTEEKTMLSYREQKKCIAILEKHGVIKVGLYGQPAKLHFSICEDKIWQLLNSSIDENAILELSKSQNYLYKEYKHKEYINQEKENLKFSQSTKKKDDYLEKKENNSTLLDALPKEEKSCEKKEEKTKDRVNYQKEIISPKKENKRVKKESAETFDEVLKTAYFAGDENRCFGKLKDGTAVEFFANHDINGKIKGYHFFLTKEQKNEFISTLGKEIFEDCCEEFADWLGRDTPTALAIKAKRECSHKDLFTKKNSWLIEKVMEKRAKKEILTAKQKNSGSLEDRILKENNQLIKQLHGKR
jgi:hypothetical protein